jgi:hypothetical protein
MSIRKLRAGRVPTVTAAEYVGQQGTIFWDEGTGTLHLSDGINPGGVLLSVQTFTSASVPTNPANGNLWFDEVTGKLYIWFDNTWVDTQPTYTLPVATSNLLGGIKVGPGVNVSDQGILTIDAAGLPISFGDFTANTNTLSVINTNEDMNLVSNGTGSINVVGDFHIHATAGGLNDTAVVSVNASGFTVINVPTINVGQTGLLINGDGTLNPASNPQVGGTTFRSIGNDGMNNPLTVDANGPGVTAGITARVARGNTATPTALQSGDTFARYAGVGWGTTNYVVDPVSGRAATDIRFVATENYTDAHGGSKIQFFTSPNGGTVRTLSAEIHSDGVHLPNSGLGITFPDGSRQVQAFEPQALPHPLLPASDNLTDLGDPTHRFRNLYLGPSSLFMADTVTDANIELKVTSGTLYLNGAQNLAVGDLTIVGNTVQARLPSIDINLGDPADTGLFTIGRQTVITTPNLGTFTSALLINGTATSVPDPSPLTFNGTLIHTVAQDGQSARIVQDAYGTANYPIYVGRKARGTIASPSAVGQGDVLMRLSANGYTDTGFMSGGSARIDFVADESFTSTSRGSQIDFWTTPVGTNAITLNASVNNDGFVGSGIRFTGDNTRQTTAGIPLTQKAIADAPFVATLGIDGKLDASQIPSSLTGAVVFKGVWDASTNTPTLSDSLPTGVETGWEYVVSVTGTRNIGDGSTLYTQGDFVIFDGVHWKVVRGSNSFTSLTGGGHITVNQSTGAMTLGSDATPVSTFSTIVSRDSSGNFAANTITANLTGNVTGNVSGNAGTVTNGVYNTGNQSIDGTKTFTSTIQGSISGNAATATNMVGGVLGSVGYQSSTDTTVQLAPNTTTTKKFLRMTGTGIVGAVPAWDTVTATDVGLGNVTNESKATMFSSPTFTGTVAGVTATMVGLGNVTNESKATMFSSPTFTGTVAGVTATMVGLGNVENTALSTSTHYIGTTSIQYNRASGAQTLAGVSISGNAGTVTNGVYTTDTGTVTNTMLAGSIANNKLSNSTISGVALGGNLSTLTFGTHLTGTSYNGSTGVTIATDATNANTASTIVARDSSGNFTAGTITANLTGTASTATNLAAATGILAGTLSITPTTVNKNGSSTQTFTLSGLTTSHKIILKSAADLAYGLFITASYASATNTVSIQFQNFSGGNITPGTFNVTYWAWI